jgi:hypothetical protein
VVPSSSVVGDDAAAARYSSRGRSSGGLAAAAETLVIDSLPEISGVVGVGDGDLLGGRGARGGSTHLQFRGNDIDRLDIDAAESISLSMRSASLTMRRIAGVSP